MTWVQKLLECQEIFIYVAIFLAKGLSYADFCDCTYSLRLPPQASSLSPFKNYIHQAV